MEITVKRVYDDPDPADGVRVLVDRLWPRGLSKERAAVDYWEKDVAPSPRLRSSWHADPDRRSDRRFAEFAADYTDELRSGEAHDALLRIVRLGETNPRVTLLYGLADERLNNAVVLRDALLAALSP